MHLRYLSLALLAVTLFGTAQAAEPTTEPATTSATQADPYAAPEAWLCLPGRDDACSAPRQRLLVAPDGSLQEQPLERPASPPPIDCFYVYPTISEDPAPNSSRVAGPGERRAVEQQLALFAPACRLFAPLYRQVTLAGLRALLTGQPTTANMALAYSDVAAAWKHYLAQHNQGRGVVLIGHSQGSLMLMQLLQREIEGQPAQARLVSAVLAGYPVEVPNGKDSGGSFKQLPLCRTGEQTGCVINYSAFRASSPPPPNALFGRTPRPGMQAGCTDPVALSGKPLDSWLLLHRNLLGLPAPREDWAALAARSPAQFVSLPGLVETACMNADDAAYLAVSLTPVTPGREAKRPADIPGDLYVAGNVFAPWGLHLIDINLVAGNLVTLIQRQGTTWLRAKDS